MLSVRRRREFFAYRNGAAEEFQRFNKGRVCGRKITLHGLQLRREAERELFCSIDPSLSDGKQEISQPLAVADIPTREILPETAINLPRAWISLEHLAAAAGMGTGLGAVPVLNSGPGQPLWDQVFNLWQTISASGALMNGRAWADAWIDKLAQLPQEENTRILIAQTDAFLQSHEVAAVALSITAIYLMQHTFSKLLRLR